MTTDTLQRLIAKRDSKGFVIGKDDKPIPLWTTPVVAFFYKAEEPINGEQNLWREVAKRAVLDALGFTSPLKQSKSEQEHRRFMLEAQNWFRFEVDEVQNVMGLAGLPYEPLRNEVLRLIEERRIGYEH